MQNRHWLTIALAGPGHCESSGLSIVLGGLSKTAIINQSKGGQAFARLRSDPFHPSLRFKQVGRYWSARVDDNYRAVAIRDNEDVIWFWIGTHADYDHLLK